MNTEEIQGKWKSVVGAVKSKYGQISDDDIARVEGNAEKLVGMVQQKTGQTRQQVEAYLKECCNSAASVADRVSDYADSAVEAIRSGYDQVANQAKRGYDYSAETVSRHPLESVGTMFGLGLLVGVMVGYSWGAQRERELTWRDRWMR